MITINSKLKILILDSNSNKDVLNAIIALNKYDVGVISTYDIKRINTFIEIKKYDVLIIGKVETIRINVVFNIIDIFLENGKEILYIKQLNENQNYLSNYLISNGCKYI